MHSNIIPRWHCCNTSDSVQWLTPALWNAAIYTHSTVVIVCVVIAHHHILTDDTLFLPSFFILFHFLAEIIFTRFSSVETSATDLSEHNSQNCFNLLPTFFSANADITVNTLEPLEISARHPICKRHPAALLQMLWRQVYPSQTCLSHRVWRKHTAARHEAGLASCLAAVNSQRTVYNADAVYSCTDHNALCIHDDELVTARRITHSYNAHFIHSYSYSTMFACCMTFIFSAEFLRRLIPSLFCCWWTIFSLKSENLSIGKSTDWRSPNWSFVSDNELYVNADIELTVFTALPCIHAVLVIAEPSVRPPVCPFVRQARELWRNESSERKNFNYH